MKIIFSAIKNSGIFEDDFMHLSEEKGTIEFKRMQTAGGIAVIYAPNGTGKTIEDMDKLRTALIRNRRR